MRCSTFGSEDFMRVPWPAARTITASAASMVFSVMLRRQDSNLDLTAPKAVVLPLHHGGPRRPRAGAARQVCQRPSPSQRSPWRTRAGADRPTWATAPDNGAMAKETDEVDRIVEAWIAQRPDLDFSPLEVLSRVDRLSRHLDRARRDAFRRSDLEPWEWDVLSALRRAGEPFQLSPKQLLQQTLVSSGTMTNRIDRLVDRAARATRSRPGRRAQHPGHPHRRRTDAGGCRDHASRGRRGACCSATLSRARPRAARRRCCASSASASTPDAVAARAASAELLGELEPARLDVVALGLERR